MERGDLVRQMLRDGADDERAPLQPLLERAQRAVWELSQLHPHSSLDQLLVDLQDVIGRPRKEER